jgi:hypothetical protein
VIRLLTPAIDVRMIPMEDIDLRKEIKLEDAIATGLVRRGRDRRVTGGVYTAKIAGQKSNMTVALYQGDDAKEVGLSHITVREH